MNMSKDRNSFGLVLIAREHVVITGTFTMTGSAMFIEITSKNSVYNHDGMLVKANYPVVHL